MVSSTSEQSLPKLSLSSLSDNDGNISESSVNPYIVFMECSVAEELWIRSTPMFMIASRQNADRVECEMLADNMMHCMMKTREAKKCGNVRCKCQVAKIADIFPKCQSFLPPDIEVWHSESLKTADFQKNVRCQVYKVKIRPDISTFFGHGTQKNVKCRLQAYLVTAWHKWFLWLWKCRILAGT